VYIILRSRMCVTQCAKQGSYRKAIKYAGVSSATEYVNTHLLGAVAQYYSTSYDWRLFTATSNHQCHILCDACTLVCRTLECQRCSATSTSDTSAYASRRLFTTTLNRQCHILCDVCTLVCRTLECQRCSATSTRSNTIIIYAPGGSSLLSQTRQWDFVS
jgi:hypothetical protein